MFFECSGMEWRSMEFWEYSNKKIHISINFTLKTNRHYDLSCIYQDNKEAHASLYHVHMKSSNIYSDSAVGVKCAIANAPVYA